MKEVSKGIFQSLGTFHMKIEARDLKQANNLLAEAMRYEEARGIKT